MNNILTWADLKCPSVQLDCLLKELICRYQCAPETTFTASFASGSLTLTVNGISQTVSLPDLDNQQLSLSGNILSLSNGGSVDLTPFVNLAETVTTITDTKSGSPIATYTDEAGNTTIINETITTIVNNGNGTATYTNEAGVSVTFPIGSASLVNNGNGTYTFTAADGSTVNITDTSLSTLVDNGDGSFTYTNEAGITTTFTVADDIVTSFINTVAGNKIADYIDEVGNVTAINETITSIVNNGDGTATYTNEAGVSTTFPIGGVTAVDNGNGTYTLTLADGSVVTITDTSISTLVANGDGTYTYTDETGAQTTFSGNLPDVITSITGTVLGNKIATYTDEVGATTDINETITSLGTPSLTGNVLTLPFVNEAGVTQTVTVDLSGLVTTDINLDTASYNASTNVITLTETDGSTHTIDLSEFSIITTTNPDGSVTVVQEGVTKFVIPAPMSLTVNAGTTDAVTDDSLGTATVGNGDIIHFWSSDGSITWGVVQGSAKTDATTNSTIIPFTASAPVGNDAGLASTTVQGAIDEVDSKVETLEDKNRAWAKTGDLQATNSEDVLVTDNILHVGKVNIGDTEANMPFSSFFTEQVKGHERIFGTSVDNDSFNETEVNFNAVSATIDIVNGNDSLENWEYLNPTSNTLTTPFLTWQRFVRFVNAYDTYKGIQVTIVNTSASNRLQIGTGLLNTIRNDRALLITTPVGAYQYVNIVGTMNWNNLRRVQFNRLNFTAAADQAFTSFIMNNMMMFDDCVINYSGTGRLFNVGGGNLNFNQGTIINMTGANGSVFGNNNQNIINTISIGYDTGVLNPVAGLVVNALASGITLNNSQSPNPIRLARPSLLTLTGTIDITQSHFVFKRSEAWNISQAIWNDAILDVSTAPSTAATLTLGGLHPIRFQNINSSTPDNATAGDKYLKINANGEIVISTI